MDAPPFARFCYLLRLLPPARRLARAHRAAVEIARADRAAADHLARLRRHPDRAHRRDRRSEEHTSELQSLMRISYAVFCLQKKTKKITQISYLLQIKIAQLLRY